MSALPPATLEGWYALHQAFATDWTALDALEGEKRHAVAGEAEALFRELGSPLEGGWSAAFRLVGGGADWFFVHLRPTLEELAEVQLGLRRSRLGQFLRPTYDYLSVTEAGMYHLTSEVSQLEEPGTEDYAQALAERLDEERRSPYLQTRLYPRIPEGMRYLSFYPMSKRRAHGQNWYTLPLEERDRLMREHGMTGRRFAGRVFQVITGSVGLDDWEWGVTLFTRDPLELKRIVTEMRYDEASAHYAEFGQFFTGILIEPEEWTALLAEGRTMA